MPVTASNNVVHDWDVAFATFGVAATLDANFNSIVSNATAGAGGATRGADLAAVNLAAPLVDGVQILVPRRVTPPTGATVPQAPAELGAGPVSLSSASVDELDELPGIGPITAQKIVDYRTEHGPFASVDDLDAVPGIGPARIEQLRELVTP
jgi:competence protein ComEA